MDLWFGDSWPIGNELGPIDAEYDAEFFPNARGGDAPLKAFSTLVSLHRKQKFINFAKNAASLDFALHQLTVFCNSRKDLLTNTDEPLTAFLCTTAQIRGYGFDHLLNKHYHYFNNARKSSTPIYDSLIAINSFYSLCKLHNIKCIIIPIFCDLLIPESLDHIVLFKDSVLIDKSLVEYTFNEKLIDDKLYEIFGAAEMDIYSHLASKEWISPNQMHPNIIGHRKLAYKLIELLENR
jgi:hypothetical protein